MVLLTKSVKRKCTEIGDKNTEIGDRIILMMESYLL